jgi:chromosome segregation ATPase
MMEVEKTIEVLLKNRARVDARFDAKFAKAEERLSRLERVVALNNRVVTRLVRHGVSLHSDVRRLDKALVRVAEAQAKGDEKMVKIEEKLVEIEDKRNGVIDVVDKSIRKNGRASGPSTGC